MVDGWRLAVGRKNGQEFLQINVETFFYEIFYTLHNPDIHCRINIGFPAVNDNTVNRQPPTANRQPSTANRQPPTVNHQPSTANGFQPRRLL